MKQANHIAAATLKAVLQAARSESFSFPESVDNPAEQYALAADEFATVLTVLNQKNSQLRELTLRKNPSGNLHLSVEQVNALLELNDKPSLRKLNLANIPLSTKQLTSLAACLNRNLKIDALSLANCALQTDALLQFAHELIRHRHPATLIDLSYNRIDAAAIVALIEKTVLVGQSFQLVLQQCALQDKNLLIILEALLQKQMGKPPLKITLDISGNELSDAVCESLARLIHAQVIGKLIAHENRFGDAGLKLLLTAAEAAKPPVPLELTIGNVFMGEGTLLLHRFNSSVIEKRLPEDETIVLDKEIITTEFLQPFLGYYHDRKIPLSAITFRECAFEIRGLQTFELLLRTVPTVQIILQGLPLQAEGLKSLLTGFLESGMIYPHLSKLCILDCGIEEDIVAFLEENRVRIMMQFPNLKKIELSPREIILIPESPTPTVVSRIGTSLSVFTGLSGFGRIVSKFLRSEEGSAPKQEIPTEKTPLVAKSQKQ